MRRLKHLFDRDLWAMDMFHWAVENVCSKKFYGLFLDYVIEYAKSRQRSHCEHVRRFDKNCNPCGRIV